MKDPYKTLDLYNQRYVKPTGTPIYFTNIYRWANQTFSDLVDQMGKLPEDDPGVMERQSSTGSGTVPLRDGAR